MKKSILFLLLVFTAFTSFAQKRGNPADSLEIKLKIITNSTNKLSYLEKHLNDAKRFPAMYYNQSQTLRDSICLKLQIDRQALWSTIFSTAYLDKKIDAIRKRTSKASNKTIQMINEGVFTAERQQEIEDIIKKINHLVIKYGFLKNTQS